MTAIDRDAIKIADDRKTEKVPTDEWGAGTYVLVRTLTADDLDQYETSLSNRRKDGVIVNQRGLRADLVVLACVDENGQPLFESSDAQWLGEKSALVLDRIFDVADELSGLSEKVKKELAKNSESRNTPGPGSE